MKLPYDDYNSKFADGRLIGTVTTQFGNPAPRHGYKLIEIYEIHNSATDTE